MSAVSTVFALAAPAKESCADVCGPIFLEKDPGVDLPWRIVADVLGVPALQLGHPLALQVLAKADDTLVAHAAPPVELAAGRNGADCTVRTPASTSRPPTIVDSATVSPSNATAEKSVTSGSR